MKTLSRLSAILLVVSLALLSGCASERPINGKTYQPYGIANENTVKSNDVTYQLSAGSVIVAILFGETVVIPVYVVGWDLWEPVAAKTPQKPVVGP